MREMAVYIANKSLIKNRYYGTTTLSLPATRLAIADALYRARVETGSDCLVECRSGWPEFVESIINETDSLSVEEINLLAYQISQMDEFQLEIFAGAVQLRQEENVDVPVTMRELINLAYNLECYEYHPGVTDDFTLGSIALENDLLDTIRGISEDVLDLLDAEKVGMEMRRLDMGSFTETGYIFPNSTQHQELYDGVHLPDIQEIPQGIISVQVVSVYRSEEKGVWMDLPATEQEMQDVLIQLKESSFDHCLIKESVSTAFPYPLAGDEDIEKLNTLAQKIQAFPDQRTLAKFKAALELEICNEVGFALDVAENLDCYDFDPEVYSPAVYAEDIFREAGIDPDDPAFFRFDFIGYGERLMQQAGHVQTAYGMIIRNENPFVLKYSQTDSTQTEGMTMQP